VTRLWTYGPTLQRSKDVTRGEKNHGRATVSVRGRQIQLEAAQVFTVDALSRCHYLLVLNLDKNCTWEQDSTTFGGVATVLTSLSVSCLR
jgi:hypothetical protein